MIASKQVAYRGVSPSLTLIRVVKKSSIIAGIFTSFRRRLLCRFGWTRGGFVFGFFTSLMASPTSGEYVH